jgi:hypothetical protein
VKVPFVVLVHGVRFELRRGIGIFRSRGLSLLKQDVTRAIEDRRYISGDQLAGRVT